MAPAELLSDGNAAAASLTLGDDELTLIDAVLPQAHGARYTEGSLPAWT